VVLNRATRQESGVLRMKSAVLTGPSTGMALQRHPVCVQQEGERGKGAIEDETLINIDCDRGCVSRKGSARCAHQQGCIRPRSYWRKLAWGACIFSSLDLTIKQQTGRTMRQLLGDHPHARGFHDELSV
jgi:hypothetical protein